MKTQKYKRLTPLRTLELVELSYNTGWTVDHRLTQLRSALVEHLRAHLTAKPRKRTRKV